MTKLNIVITSEGPYVVEKDDNRSRHIIRELVRILQTQLHFETLNIVATLIKDDGVQFSYFFNEGRESKVKGN